MNVSTSMYHRKSVQAKGIKKASTRSFKQDKRQAKKLIRYVKTVEIVFYDIPRTYRELLNQSTSYSKSHNALVTWLRHNKTNYEDLIHSCQNRYSCTYEDRLLAVEILRQRCANLCCKLIGELREKA